MLLLGGFAVWTGYFILFEGLRQGQTPGKRMVGIRVVSDTGNAVSLGAPRRAQSASHRRFPASSLPHRRRAGRASPERQAAGRLVAGTWWCGIGPGAGRLERSLCRGARRGDRTARADRRGVPGAGAVRGAAGAELARTGGAGSRPRSSVGWPITAPRQGSAIWSTCWSCTAGSASGGRDRAWSGLGRHRGFAARKRAPMGRSSSDWRIAPPRHGLDSFASEELPDFAARYREVAADLARARTYGVDEATLEHARAPGGGRSQRALSRRARHLAPSLGTVLVRECPAAIREARGYVAVACLAFLLPAAAGYALMREQPDLAVEVLPDVMIDRADAGAERMAAGTALRGRGGGGPPADGVGDHHEQRPGGDRLLRGRHLSRGRLTRPAGLQRTRHRRHGRSFRQCRGLLGYLLEFILGHGLLELFAIWVAGAAGFLLGRSVVVPGPT